MDFWIGMTRSKYGSTYERLGLDRANQLLTLAQAWIELGLGLGHLWVLCQMCWSPFWALYFCFSFGPLFWKLLISLSSIRSYLVIHLKVHWDFFNHFIHQWNCFERSMLLCTCLSNSNRRIVSHRVLIFFHSKFTHMVGHWRRSYTELRVNFWV